MDEAKVGCAWLFALIFCWGLLAGVVNARFATIFVGALVLVSLLAALGLIGRRRAAARPREPGAADEGHPDELAEQRRRLMSGGRSARPGDRPYDRHGGPGRRRRS